MGEFALTFDSHFWSGLRVVFYPSTLPASLLDFFPTSIHSMAWEYSSVTAIHGQQSVTTASRHWMKALDEVCPSCFASEECFRKVSLAAAVSPSH